MRDRRLRQRGFTLIEVLVALAIVGLGMAAIFAQLNQSLLATERLRSKTLAAWIANDRIVEHRVAQQYPEPGERSDEFTMAGIEWAYTVKTTQTAVEGIRRIDVAVSDAQRPDSVLATVTGFLREPVEVRLETTDSGWPLQNPDGAVEDTGAPDDAGADEDTGAADGEEPGAAGEDEDSG